MARLHWGPELHPSNFQPKSDGLQPTMTLLFGNFARYVAPNRWCAPGSTTAPSLKFCATNCYIIRLAVQLTPYHVLQRSLDIHQPLAVSCKFWPKIQSGDGVGCRRGGLQKCFVAPTAGQPDDTKPHYTESSGDYIYKMPNQGATALSLATR